MARLRGMGALLMAAGALFSASGAHAGATSNWAFSKAFGAATIPLNGSTSLTFSISNNSLNPASAIAFTDNLPAGLVVSTPNALVGNCGAGSVVSAAPGGGSVSLSAGQLAPTSSCNFSVNVTGTTVGVKNNITSILTSDLPPNAGGAIASLTVLAAALGVASVPTLSEWGLILLVLGVGVSALNGMRRRR